MAGRFLFQKLTSRLSRSASVLGAHASALVTRRASEGCVRTLTNFSRGPVAHHTTVVPSNPRIHGYEGGIRTLHNLFGAASAHTSTTFLNIREIHHSPTRYLSTFRSTRAASKRSSPLKGVPPVMTGSTKPTLVDYVRVKRHFSSRPSAKGTISWEQYLSAREPQWQANLEAARAASKAECAAWEAEWKAKDAAFDRFVTVIVGSWTVIGLVFVSSLGSESSRGGTISCEGQSSSYCQSCAASANTVVPHPNVQ